MPVGAREILLKSKCLYKHAWAESFGCHQDDCRRFNVASACGMRRSHFLVGKSESHVASPAQKWLLRVWMAVLASLRIWLWGSTRCKLTV